MHSPLYKAALCSTLFLAASTARGQIINFDNLDDAFIPDGYHALTWEQIYPVNKNDTTAPGYQVGTTSGEVAAFSAYPQAKISASPETPFNVISANFTSVFHTQSLRLEGFAKGVQKYITPYYNITPDSSLNISIDFQNIDQLIITSDASQHWVMDDFEFNFINPIPEPASLGTLLGALALGAMLKRTPS